MVQYWMWACISAQCSKRSRARRLDSIFCIIAGTPADPCDGIVCANGGTQDPATCDCTCTTTHTGPTCESKSIKQ